MPMGKMWSLSMLLGLLLCLFGSASTPAAEPIVVPLWSDRGESSDPEWSDAAKARMTVIRPDQPNGTAIVICPGGGYGGLVTGPEGTGIAQWLNKSGITGVVLEYRLPAGRHAVPLRDAQRALRLVRSRAAEWGLKPTRVGILGFSAGGHLASTAATHFDEGQPTAPVAADRLSSRPDFAILVYPVVTMGESTHGGSRKNLLGDNPSADLIRLYSNELQVGPKTPPMYLTHALDDKPVPPEHSQRLYTALQKQQIPSEYLELPSGGHGLNGYQGPMWEAWQAGSLKWLAALKLPAGQ